MENQIVKIDDLKIGDEFIISCNGSLRRARAISPLRKSKAIWGKMYTNVKCEILNVHDTQDETITRTMYLDLNYNDMWLIKRTAI